jgi:DNA-binding NarL/FixJ family response regulator
VIRVAIFEDNKHLLETLRMLLEGTPGYTCTGAYPNCKNMLPLLQSYPCDIVLMDIEMPGMNGIEATKLIKEMFPAMQVLIQTVFSEDQYIFNAICAGASGYILKSTTPQGYLQAIADVNAGGSPMTPGIARRVLELFRDNTPVAPAPVKDYKLTPQEKKILQLLVDGKSYKMIATELFIAVETVKTHVGNIYGKLQVHSGTEAVSKAIRDRIV